MGVRAMIPPNLLKALLAASFHERYYAICETHPLRHEVRCKSGAREVERVLADIGRVQKFKGPGRVFAVTAPSQSPSLEFSFLIFSDGVMLEPCLNFIEGEQRIGTNFCVLAYATNQAAGRSPLNPPHPRPCFYSLTEFRTAVTSLLQLALYVGRAYYAQ